MIFNKKKIINWKVHDYISNPHLIKKYISFSNSNPHGKLELN